MVSVETSKCSARSATRRLGARFSSARIAPDDRISHVLRAWFVARLVRSRERVPYQSHGRLISRHDLVSFGI